MFKKFFKPLDHLEDRINKQWDRFCEVSLDNPEKVVLIIKKETFYLEPVVSVEIRVDPDFIIKTKFLISDTDYKIYNKLAKHFTNINKLTNQLKKEEKTMTNINSVKVRFEGSSKEYAYEYDWDFPVKAGDYVVVDSPLNGYTTAKVVSTHTTKLQAATTRVVSPVNDREYKEKSYTSAQKKLMSAYKRGVSNEKIIPFTRFRYGVQQVCLKNNYGGTLVAVKSSFVYDMSLDELTTYVRGLVN